MKCHKICDAADAFSGCCAAKCHVPPTAWRILAVQSCACLLRTYYCAVTVLFHV